MQAKLIVRRGSANRREVTATLPITIGRSTDCKLTIEHRTVSRRHCEIVEHDGAVFIRDMGSSNGTLVGGELVNDETQLETGAELTIGPLVFGVELTGTAKPPQPSTQIVDAPAVQPEPSAPAETEQSDVDTLVAKTTVTDFGDATVRATGRGGRARGSRAGRRRGAGSGRFGGGPSRHAAQAQRDTGRNAGRGGRQGRVLPPKKSNSPSTMNKKTATKNWISRPTKANPRRPFRRTKKRSVAKTWHLRWTTIYSLKTSCS